MRGEKKRSADEALSSKIFGVMEANWNKLKRFVILVVCTPYLGLGICSAAWTWRYLDDHSICMSFQVKPSLFCLVTSSRQRHLELQNTRHCIGPTITLLHHHLANRSLGDDETRSAAMINAFLVFNGQGQPRLTKFYTQLVRCGHVDSCKARNEPLTQHRSNHRTPAFSSA